MLADQMAMHFFQVPSNDVALFIEAMIEEADDRRHVSYVDSFAHCEKKITSKITLGTSCFQKFPGDENYLYAGCRKKRIVQGSRVFFL
jgi:hypothetical protein